MSSPSDPPEAPREAPLVTGRATQPPGALHTLPLAGAGAGTPASEAQGGPAHEALVGRVLGGRYELTRVLGSGGMGIVYEARHVTVGHRVAVKVLRRDLARSSDATARFQREAKAAGALRSDYIVDVFDYGQTDDGDAFLAMELLEGEDLRRLVQREGALDERRVRRLGAQIARGLARAHERGIVHRDLKSENVFVVRSEAGEQAKILDFGISKITEPEADGAPRTIDGAVLGTPHYMAPEQVANSAEVDHRADIYALGCLLYEMATGRLPFAGRTTMEVVYKQVHDAPEDPRALRPELSDELAAVLLCALEKRPADRFADALSMARALEGVERDAPSARPRTVSLAVRPAPRARATRWGLVAFACAGFASAGVYVAGAAHRPRLRAPAALALPTLSPARSSSPAALASAARGAPGAPLRVPLAVAPATARVRLDGASLAAGSSELELRPGQRFVLELEAPGYVSQAHNLVAGEAPSLTFTLQRATSAVERGPRPTERVGETSAPPASASARAIDPADGLKTSPYGARSRLAPSG